MSKLRDYSVAPEFEEWRQKLASQGVECVGQNEVWNAAVKATLDSLSASPVQAEPVKRQTVQELLALYDKHNGDWFAVARAVEDRFAHPPSGKDAEDAEMYRWIRDSGYSELYVHGLPGIDNCKQIAGEGLDEAIRAAMSAAGNPDNSEMPNNLPAEGSRG